MSISIFIPMPSIFVTILRLFPFNKILVNLCKSLVILGIIFFMFLAFLSYKSQNIWTTTTSQTFTTNISPTNISHIVFGISSSIKSWPQRRNYIQSWWRPNITRGYIFFDKPPNNLQSPSLPLFKVSEDTTKFQVFSNHINPSVIRIVRAILETYRAEDEDGSIRWYVMGDDDTIFFVDNLVKVLQKFDHRKYFYVGGVSECTKSNFDFSFGMAFGGGGFALSRRLASALVTNLDYCIERYKEYRVSDMILQSCIADIGVSLTTHGGFHQIDLRGDISGFLSSHPQSPLLSLHHLDIVLPIFPSMNRYESVKHLMKAGDAAGQSRLLQQTICYDKHKNWTYSISWGYSVYIFEQIYPRSVLKMRLEMFDPWNGRSRPPFYMFNTRKLEPDDPCKAPHVFFFESLNFTAERVQVVTNYVRSSSSGRLSPCSSKSAIQISKIRVFSTSVTIDETDNRGECCDLLQDHHMNISTAKFRRCVEGEIVA